MSKLTEFEKINNELEKSAKEYNTNVIEFVVLIPKIEKLNPVIDPNILN